MVSIDFFYKYKYFIFFLIIITTILIGIYFFNSNKNDEENYEFELQNFEQESTKIIEDKKIRVHICGEVINPGVIEIEEGKRIIDAINIVGGTTEHADLNKINLAAELEDAMKVYIPNKDEDIELETTEETSVNINTASEADLQKIAGIGSSIAKRIVEYRKQNGKFNNIEDIKNVGGIGDSKFESIKKYIYVK